MANSVAWISQASQTLLTNLIAYYKMDENVASGSRSDSGPNGLTLTDTVPNVSNTATGKILRGVDMVGNNGQLKSADNSLWQVGGNQDFTWQVWFNPTGHNYTGFNCLVDKGAFTGNGDEYFLAFDNAAHLRFAVGNGTSFAQALWGSAITDSTWHHVIAWYDHILQTVNIRIDNGTTVTTPWTLGTQSTTGQPLSLLSKSSAVSNAYTAQMDEVGFWKRVLTTAEQNSLWNGGAGLAFSNFGSTP